MINLVLKIQENTTLLKLYRLASSLIQVIPYYIMEEFVTDPQKLKVPLKIKDSRICWLTREDMDYLGNHAESNQTTEELIGLLEHECLCLAAKCKGEIAAYSWCDLKNMEYKGRVVPLKRNEAYLFDARTYQAFRGKNLAPYVRYELCKFLKKKGIERFFSISLWSNSASMKFKQKLGAKPTELFLYFGLFRKFRLHFRLRNLASVRSTSSQYEISKPKRYAG